MTEPEALPSWVTDEDPLAIPDDEDAPRSPLALKQAQRRQRMLTQMAAWRAGPCEQCGGDEHPREMAHLRPTGLNGRGRGIERRYYDARRHPKSYARLCVPCHRTHDRSNARLRRRQLPYADPVLPWAR